MHAVRLMNGDVFAEPKALVAEMISGFIGCRTGHVVMEAPAAAPTMNEMTELIVFRGALTNDAASLAMGFPGLDIDPRCRVERGNDDIADRGRALGVIMLARALKPNLPERVRQRSVLQRREGGAIHQKSP
ncbi:hypothetical protein [Bradyrhizobium sp. USDA 4350]